MRNATIILSLFFLLIIPCRSAVNDDGHFLKRIENNYANNVIVELSNGKTDGMYNFNSKSPMEKLFFGDFNAPVEYFVDPSFCPLTGFRIYPDSLGRSYLLETKKREGKKHDYFTSDSDKQPIGRYHTCKNNGHDRYFYSKRKAGCDIRWRHCNFSLCGAK